MTRLEKPRMARLDQPRCVATFPFAETIDISDAGVSPDEPSPCLASATAVWYLLDPPSPGTVTIDLAGSTQPDAVVRLYRRSRDGRDSLEFLGCASPVWNGQLSLDALTQPGDAVLAQVGTSESHAGTLVIRIELH